MWFKNLRIYRLTEAVELSDEELNEALETKLFQPCGKLDPMRYGWVSPLGRNGKSLTHSAGNCTMLCGKRQEKIIPNAAIKEALDNKIFEIREEEGRPVGRKERESMKDELIFSMLPQALPKSSVEFGYFNTRENLFYVNVSSAKKAEDFLSLLRETTGSLKAVPIGTHQPIMPILTEWVRNGEAPAPFALGDTCELRASKDERVVRFRKQDLSADEVRQHLDAGMHVRQLALEWKESISFVIDDELSIKSVKFSDELIEKAGDADADTEAAAFDNDFAIMTAEISVLTKDLLAAFGGESELY